jgi:hypothetical protein
MGFFDGPIGALAHVSLSQLAERPLFDFTFGAQAAAPPARPEGAGGETAATKT